MVILWSVQLFEHVTVAGGGRSILDVDTLLTALADPTRRSAPEYWWLYAMLFSTLLPSVSQMQCSGRFPYPEEFPSLHAFLGNENATRGCRIERGSRVDGLRAGGPTDVCAILGLALFSGLIWVIVTIEIPIVGLRSCSMLQELAAADLPGKFLKLFSGLGTILLRCNSGDAILN